MRKKHLSQSAFFYLRTLIGFSLCFLAVALALFGFDVPVSQAPQIETQTPIGSNRRPHGMTAVRAARSFDGDLRRLPHIRPIKKERPERAPPPFIPRLYQPAGGTSTAAVTSNVSSSAPAQTFSVPAPAPLFTFDGLDYATWGAGHPPDENGDVGPTYYIQAVNTSIGIFDKTTGNRVAAFTFDTFMSQGQFGNLCDTDNFGDPVVLYDSFDDRWIITDFAFKQDSSGNVINPPGIFQCFAVSKSGDPVSGGWNYYSINITGGLDDYPKFGVWTDGIYMSANMYDYAVSGHYLNPRVYAFNKAQMYAGAPTFQVVQFDAPSVDFTLLPSDARLQTGTPPPGTPNYFISTSEYLNALTVYKFHVDWNHISLSTFTGPDIPSTGSSLPSQSVPDAETPANSLDTLGIRAMARNQYANIGGVESLWTIHTVERATDGFATPRWYQVNVTGGNVAATTLQTATWDPDGANLMHRYVPSLAVDRMGDMAIGYSTSNSATNPGIMYAGRLATDPINTFSQSEQIMFQGTGTQLGKCGASSCHRWGDYTAMVLDPVDGCTFWYTNEYYAVNGLNNLTRIGAFKYSQCIPAGIGGNVSGQVTDSSTGNPIIGATVLLGSGRTATTDGNGNYSFNGIPAGTYPSITATSAGYTSFSHTSVLVTDNATTTDNFALTVAPGDGCITDTTQSDFQSGIPMNVDLNGSPGDIMLLSPAAINQQQLNNGGVGSVFNKTTWIGQTFVPSVSGTLTKLDLNLLCSNCSGSNPDLQVEVRTVSGGLPTSLVLATASIPGFSNGGAAFYSAAFANPATLIAGAQYAYTVHINTARTGTYAAIYSTTSSAYANGDRVQSTNSGSTWTIPKSGGTARDLSFKAYINSGYAASGTFISSVKDANPAGGATPSWGVLVSNASVPANTALNFQVAASNGVGGPFNFVGPDGTVNTYFHSGDSLSQFNGFRYLTYKAILSTADGGATPTVNDVTLCFSDTGIPPTPTPTPIPTATPNPTPTPAPTPTISPAPPATIQVTVKTSLSGLAFTVDGTSYSATQVFIWVSGSNHTIATTSPQSGGTGIQFLWTKWSDSGAISHTVAPTTNTTYTATFTEQYYLTMNAGTGGKVTPTSGWKNSGTTVSIAATAVNNTLASYNFSSWSGAGTGSYSGTNNPASITMNGPITEVASFTQNPVQIIVQPNPVGLSFSVDGVSYTTTQSFSWDPGSSHTLATSSPQNGATGVRSVWNTWSDGGAISHTVAPTSNKSYTAKFTTQYYLTMSAGTGGKVSPSSGWKNSGAVVSITGTPNNGYIFSSWTGGGSGSFSGTNNPGSVTMSGPIVETATFRQNPSSTPTPTPTATPTATPTPTPTATPTPTDTPTPTPVPTPTPTPTDTPTPTPAPTPTPTPTDTPTPTPAPTPTPTPTDTPTPTPAPTPTPTPTDTPTPSPTDTPTPSPADTPTPTPTDSPTP